MSATTHRRPVWGPDAPTAAALVATVAVVWLAMKLISVWAWVIAPGQYGDTYYYFLSAQEAARGGGIASALAEYPTPAGWLLLLPYQWGATGHESYRAAIVGMTSLADAAFAVALGRRLGPVPVLAWVLLTSSLGQLALLRFDMLPAVAAGAAVLMAMGGRRTAAAVLLALGTGLKLWPIVLVPLLLRRRRNRRPLLAFAATGAALVAASLAAGGPERLLSPLRYQNERGLQIEAVAATVPMHVWAGDDAYRVWFSGFHAYEVLGPAVEVWLHVARAASVVGALGCLVLLAWWWHHRTPWASVAWLALACVGAFIVTSRALSPQYLLWLAVPVAVLVGFAWLGGPDAPPLGPSLVTFAAALALCVLTTAVYPVYYAGVVARSPTTGVAVALLSARNIGLVAFVAWCAACAVVTPAPRTPPATDSAGASAPGTRPH